MSEEAKTPSSPPDKLSPDASPSLMEIKTGKARRINNRPVVIATILIALILLTFVQVLMGRGNSTGLEAAQSAQQGKSATAQAKDVVNSMGGAGGVVNPPAPPAPNASEQSMEPKEKELQTPPPPLVPEPRIPEPPRLTDEAKKMRDRRFRQMEQAIDALIQVRIDEKELAVSGIDGEMARLEQQLVALNGQESQTYEQRLASITAAANGGGGTTDYNTRGDLSRMRQFAGETDWSNPATVEAPATKHIIRTGSVIPATLISGINSDLPGQIVGQVSQNVYDTPTGKHVLIPQGSRLVGEYSSQVQYGQSRVFAVWQRIIFPDGKALDLGEMPGSSGAGYAGFRDRVNNHYIRIFGSAIMMSAILAGVEMTQENQDTEEGNDQQRMSDAISEALGQQFGGVMAEMLQKNMNISPTLEIRPGYRFNVMLVKDLLFDGAYAAFDYTAQ